MSYADTRHVWKVCTGLSTTVPLGVNHGAQLRLPEFHAKHTLAGTLCAHNRGLSFVLQQVDPISLMCIKVLCVLHMLRLLGACTHGNVHSWQCCRPPKYAC